jgi:hypothetical protein
MNVLALDLATKTGWALREGDRIESGVQDFTKKRGESNGMLFLHFNAWLDGIGGKQGAYGTLGWPMFRSKTVDLIVFEQAHHRGGAATEIAVGLMTRVLEFSARYYIEHSSVHSLTLKKWATGSGKADKAAMIAAANRFLRDQGRMDIIEDDDQADAILLLHYALSEILGEKEWNAQPAAAGS